MTLSSPVVLDNTVLTNFALSQGAELVFRLWAERACTTPAVMEEYRAGVDAGTVPGGAWANLVVTALSAEEDTVLASLPQRLGLGEKSCLAVASCRGGALVSDDLDARRTAANLGVQISGTVGILLACVKKRILDPAEANRQLTVMIGHGYHSPWTKIDDLL